MRTKFKVSTSSYWLCLFAIAAIFSGLMARSLEAQESDEETSYQDPFANESPATEDPVTESSTVDNPASNLSPPPTESLEPELTPLESPAANFAPSDSMSTPAPNFDSSAPAPGSANSPEPSLGPSDLTIESAPSAPSPNIEFPFEEKPLLFPGAEDDGSPVTQDVFKRETREAVTRTWHLAVDLGIALNLNRRQEQFHIDMGGGYRLTPEWELAGSMYYRSIKDQLIGFIAEGRYVWTFYETPSLVMELLPIAGLGWTLRALPSSSKFTEGRMTVRLGAQWLGYFLPSTAAVATLNIDSYIFSLRQGAGAQNLMKNGGPPTQALLTFGVRWDF